MNTNTSPGGGKGVYLAVKYLSVGGAALSSVNTAETDLFFACNSAADHTFRMAGHSKTIVQPSFPLFCRCSTIGISQGAGVTVRRLEPHGRPGPRAECSP